MSIKMRPVADITAELAETDKQIQVLEERRDVLRSQQKEHQTQRLVKIGEAVAEAMKAGKQVPLVDVVQGVDAQIAADAEAARVAKETRTANGKGRGRGTAQPPPTTPPTPPIPPVDGAKDASHE